MLVAVANFTTLYYHGPIGHTSYYSPASSAASHSQEPTTNQAMFASTSYMILSLNFSTRQVCSSVCWLVDLSIWNSGKQLYSIIVIANYVTMLLCKFRCKCLYEFINGCRDTRMIEYSLLLCIYVCVCMHVG